LTPAARLEAAAQLLDRIAATRAPAESVLKTWAQQNRYAGSGDRRAIADRVYACLRARGRLVFAMGEDTGRALVLGSLALLDGAALDQIEQLYTGQGYGPAPLSAEERDRLNAPLPPTPDWVRLGLPEFVAADLRRTFGEAWVDEASALLQGRAPLDLRVVMSRSDVAAVMSELAQAGLAPRPTPFSAWGVRLAPEPAPDLQGLPAFAEGRFEIQDEGSQIVAWLAGAGLGGTVVDYCAGGGGKTLALLALSKATRAQVRLAACDTDPRRLDAIRPRLARAGETADLRLLTADADDLHDLRAAADLVLVDAPCSGSGTWRRRPEEAGRLTSDAVARFQALQLTILDRAAALVKPGGRLAYVTCSILAAENEDTIAAFAVAHPEFRPSPIRDALNSAALTEAARTTLAAQAGERHHMRLSPRATGTDGFFLALYERTP
jgi:16S rRNA (cytosine967-C5)-methyltransferase